LFFKSANFVVLVVSARSTAFWLILPRRQASKRKEKTKPTPDEEKQIAKMMEVRFVSCDLVVAIISSEWARVALSLRRCALLLHRAAHLHSKSFCPSQDPTFRAMFFDVMKDMSDDKARQEQEDYLTQLETQGALGAGAQLLKPQPSFCVSIKPSSLSKKAADAHFEWQMLM
jgi:hypothetical protein